MPQQVRALNSVLPSGAQHVVAHSELLSTHALTLCVSCRVILNNISSGGVGYYLYTAGGNPKVAEKQFESDLSKASAKIKSEVPGRAKEAQKEGEKWASVAGSKVDSAVSVHMSLLPVLQLCPCHERPRVISVLPANQIFQVDKARAEATKMEAYGKDAKADAMKKIDAADRKIETKAAEAKSGISSWFGGK